MTIQKLKVATYNIRTDTPSDGPVNGTFRWSNRFPYVKELIDCHKWDIIGIQEARQNQFDDLTALPDYESVGMKRACSAEGEYNPILFNKHLFELVETETSWLSPNGEKNSQAYEWDAAYPRIYTTARLRIKESGQLITVINTHFDHFSEEARYRSAQLIAKKVSEIPSKESVFLTGDFNGDRFERWYKTMSKVLIDSEIQSLHRVGPDVTCTLATLDSVPQWEDMVKIDYIFVSNHIDIVKTQVHTDKFNGYFPSDHFPVSLECSLHKTPLLNAHSFQ